jgi:hypothetical protein
MNTGAAKPVSPTTAVTAPAKISPRIIRRIVLVVFVLGIGGMIGGSIAEVTGLAITFGLITAIAALALVLVTSVAPEGSLAKQGEAVSRPVDEQLAGDLEDRILALVDQGADETMVRKLVGRAIELGEQSR